MESKILNPRQVAVCAIDAEHTCLPGLPAWLDVANVLGASNLSWAIAHLPACTTLYHTLSIAVYDFSNLSTIPSGREIEGFQVIVRGKAQSSDAIYVGSVRLARRCIQTPERWADKGKPREKLKTSMSNITIGKKNDRWKTNDDIPDTTVLKDSNQGYGNEFGVVLRFAQYLPKQEQVDLAWIKLTVHYA